jgi:hypothetical protein
MLYFPRFGTFYPEKSGTPGQEDDETTKKAIQTFAENFFSFCQHRNCELKKNWGHCYDH